MTTKELGAVCSALNILFWKVDIGKGRSANTTGEWWAAELRDKDIQIRWDKARGEFMPEGEA